MFQAQKVAPKKSWEQNVDGSAPHRIVSAGRCPKTGKIQFHNAVDAIEALRS